MKRQIIYSIFAFILSMTLISCDPCRNLDCITDRYEGRFRIVSKIDGKDLVFGSNAIYDKTKIKFYSVNATDTTFFEYNQIKTQGSGFDSILNVRFFPETSTPAYIKLSDVDIDTLTIFYNTFKSKCCGRITEILKFRYNGTTDLLGDQGVIEIKK